MLNVASAIRSAWQTVALHHPKLKCFKEIKASPSAICLVQLTMVDDL